VPQRRHAAVTYVQDLVASTPKPLAFTGMHLAVEIVNAQSRLRDAAFASQGALGSGLLKAFSHHYQ